jgi:ketosteroid isomerase-like protein
MQPSRQTIETLYGAFQRLDADAMAACYSPDARFEDEVFTLAGRREVAAMWRMLCESVKAQGGEGWQLQWDGVRTDGVAGAARWEARYKFSATGRPVHNRISAAFEFDGEGRILRHRDRFDFWRWSRQALGTPGLFLGWTPQLRAAVRKKARASLDRFLVREPR